MAWAGLGGDMGQFSIRFELGYSKTSIIGDLAVSASLERIVLINRVNVLKGARD